MATPIIRSVGSTSGTVTGTGRDDLVIGETVTLTDTAGANAGHSYSWTFADKPVGSNAAITNALTATATFVPDVTGSYKVRCTVDGAASSEKILGVPLAMTGARIPAFKEGEDYDGGGNVLGWHETQTTFMREADRALLASTRTVLNYAAVRAMAAADAPLWPTLYVRGYSTAGDGGEGVFRWDAASTATDNDGTILKLAAVTTGRYLRDYSGAVRTGWFGVKSGAVSQPGIDPVVNQNRIVAALTLAASTQKWCEFDTGIHYVWPGIDIWSIVASTSGRLSLRGQGAQWANNEGTCIRVKQPDGVTTYAPYVMKFGGSVNQKDIWYDGAFIADNVAVVKSQSSGSNFDRVTFSRAIPLTLNGATATISAATNASPIEITHNAPSTVWTVTGATNATPIEMTTSVSHGLSTGTRVYVKNVLGNLGANGRFYIDVTAANKFTLRWSVGTGAYTSGGTVEIETFINAERVTISGVTGNTAANGNFQITVTAPNKFTLNGSTGNGAYVSGGTIKADPRPSKSNLFTTEEDDYSQADAVHFHSCHFNQDPYGEGGDARTKRGHACVNNYHQFHNAISNPQAFLWTADAHCSFVGNDYAVRGGTQFSMSLYDPTFYDTGTSIVRVENGGITIYNAYAESGQVNYTNPKILMQEGSAGGKIIIRDSQFNLTDADIVLNGCALTRLDTVTLGGNVAITPSGDVGAKYVPQVFTAMGFISGKSVTYPSSFNPWVLKLGEAQIGQSMMQDAHIPRLVVGETASARARISNSVSGAVWMTNAAKETTVTFGSAMPDANYHVYVSAVMESSPETCPRVYSRANGTGSFIIGYVENIAGGLTLQVNWKAEWTVS